MKIDENKYKSAIAILLIALVSITFTTMIVLTQLSERLGELFYYQADADLCFEQARLVQSYCHVERDEDGSYNWYYLPYEAGTPTEETTSKVLSPAEVVELWES